MLKRLTIHNYALIADAAIDFENQLTVITGESGAGKSIMLEALGLLLGTRAEFSVIRNGQDKSVVEAEFAGYDKRINQRLTEEGLDKYERLIIRRELTRSGRSRAFVNDTPVSLQVLKAIGPWLIDLHGQQENLSLQSAEFKWSQLDAFANAESTHSRFREAHAEWKKCRQRLDQLNEAAAQVRKDQDYFEFQLAELSALDLDESQVNALESELNELENATTILKALDGVVAILSEDDHGAEALMSRARRELDSVAAHSKGVEEVAGRLTELYHELSDVHAELQSLANRIEVNPERMEQVRDQLDEVNRLCHKHGVRTIEELIEIREEYEVKLAGISSFEEEQRALEEQLSKLQGQRIELANALDEERRAVSERFAEEVCTQLHNLGMPKAHFKVQLTRLEEVGPHGWSEIEMLFDANGSDRLLPIEHAASGGEMARLMLAMKHVNRSKASAATVIFDEIDTGVSGEVALKVGTVMSQLAAQTQVIAVTHLPGVAAKGTQHLRISKREELGQVVSRFDYLDKEARVLELATMFSGDQPTENDLASARGLIGH